MNAAAGHLPRSIAWRRSWICVSSSGKPLNAPFHYPSPAPLRICWTRSIPLKNGSAVHEYKDATAIGRPSFQAPSAAFMSGDGFSLGPPTGRALGQIRPVAAG